MLQEIVDDGGWPGWKRGCTDLVKRLGQAAKTPAQPAPAKAAADMSPAAARKALEKKRGQFETEDGRLCFRCFRENALTDADLAMLACAGDLLRVVGRMPHLRSLDLYYAERVSDAGLRHLGSLKSLESLNIGYVKSDGSALTSLAAAKLKRLEARGLKLSQAGAKAIGSLASLEELDLGAGRLTSGKAYCPEASHSREPSRTARSLPDAASVTDTRPAGSALRICSSAAAIFGVDIFAALSAPATRNTSSSWNV